MRNEPGLQDEPGDPIGQATMAMIGMHEMFVAAVAAGFTRYEACVMLGSYMAGLGNARG